MAISKQKKEQIVEKLEKAAREAVSLVFVNFHGLTVGDATNLRKNLVSKNIGYFVAKKSLLRRALGALKFEGDMPSLQGEIAVAYGPDALETAREIYIFQKDHRDQLKIAGGVFEKKFMDAVGMTEIATIPPREVLYGQLVGMFASPVRGLAIVLSEIAKNKETVKI